MRKTSFGEGYQPSRVDRFGVWLSRKQIRKWVKNFSGLRVGDFGCGYHAATARTWLKDVASLTLVDISLAKDLKNQPKIRAIEGILPAALSSIPDSSLDVVLFISILEHLRDPLLALKECFRVVAHNGVCLVNVPSWRGKVFLEFSAFRLGLSPPEEMDDHKMYYDVRDLWPILIQSGFFPREVHCFSHKLGLNTFAFCRAKKS